MYTPLNYGQITAADSAFIPSMVKNRNNKTYAFWERAFFQRACSTLKIGVPTIWGGNTKDFLYYCLFRFGYVPVFETPETGTVFTPADLTGYDFYYQPTNAIIANPALRNSLNLKIGEECELLKLTPDYMGVWDIIAYYAEKMSIMDNSINISIINSKMAYLLFAKNKAAAETIKKAFDKINRGEPGVVLDQKLANDPATKAEPWQFLERTNIKNSYITTDLLMDYHTIMNDFDTEIGIPVLPYQKKERMVTSEAESKIMDATSRSVVWYETLKESMEKVNKRFPELKLTVELRHDPEEASEAKEVQEDGIR